MKRVDFTAPSVSSVGSSEELSFFLIPVTKKKERKKKCFLSQSSASSFNGISETQQKAEETLPLGDNKQYQLVLIFAGKIKCQ